MGSLETGISVKSDYHLLRSSSATGKNALGQRQARSRFARLFLVNKIDYLQWICTVAVFFFFVVVFQMFLPGSLMEKSMNFSEDSEDLAFLKELGALDFGEDIKFEPSNLLAKFRNEAGEANGTVASRAIMRFGYRKPKLALVFANLLVDPYQIMMANVAAALQEIGYEIEVLSFEDGPVRSIWKGVGVPVIIMGTNGHTKISVDWLNYDGLLMNSLEVVNVLSCLMQEPFKNIPLIWTINELKLAARLEQYISSDQIDFVDKWREVFTRASVVVFSNYILPIAYSVFDAGNYFVIPGSPKEAWEADNMAVPEDNLRAKLDYAPEDFVIVVVGSQLLYKGLWLEQALVLQALLPAFPKSSNENSNSSFKIVFLAGGSNANYSAAVEAIAWNLRYPKGMVKHVAPAKDTDRTLSIADLVIYASLREEQSFPNTLLKAMCLGKPIIAPDLSMIKKYVDDGVNGYLFPKENISFLTQIMSQVVSNGKLSLQAHDAASVGQRTARNLMVSESVEGYALLLENILRLPSEVAHPKTVTEVPAKLKAERQWHLFEAIETKYSQNKTLETSGYLDIFERQWKNHTQREGTASVVEDNVTFLYSISEDHRNTEIANRRKQREDEELKDRTDQPRGTWEEVYKNAKKADRSRYDLHERDEGELERTGQPLCIYEPYYGEGTWPFLHRTSLYHGLGLSTQGRRPGHDDIDAPSRLPLLNNPYYRDVLGEYGAFFAIANRIDRIHKNAWIGFQSWRSTARQESLSKTAEKSLLEAIEARRHGDTLYFWARMDVDPRNQLKQDFWSFCDALNAGNCQYAFSEALKKMYGLKQNFSSLPPMPVDGGTWSVMHCWVLPTKSFLEFVMFSRIFVDALDSQFYEDHHGRGHCYLSLTQDKHCYSRVLEMLVNVWAYHSARRMMYVNPQSGLMQEQHRVKSRKGKMWVKWFQYDTLKSMDEELAEESDSDQPKKRWLWPSTGEIFWQGMYEKERNLRNIEKEKKKQQSKDKILRIRKRTRQKAIGKYVKPPPEELEDSNSTAITAKLMR